MRRRIRVKPPARKHGELAFEVPLQLLEDWGELHLTLSLITNRTLFGWVYGGLLPDHVDDMPLESGVYIHPVLQTSLLGAGMTKPGDVDLLIIPYEGDELILSQTMAIEIKVIRASFARQGRSPNEFGFSQAKSLLELGFPYVAVAHLIVSDSAPENTWREASVFRVLPGTDRVEPLPTMTVDLMPIDLTSRAFGRLEKAGRDVPLIGLTAVYMGYDRESVFGGSRLWWPKDRAARENPAVSSKLLTSIGDLFEDRPFSFWNNPRYDLADRAVTR